MIEELKNKVNDLIYTKLAEKQELYNSISSVESDLVELNDLSEALSNRSTFFKISPNAAFNMLEKIGIDDKEEQLNIYFNLIGNEDYEEEYAHKIENINEFHEQTESQKEFSEKMIDIFDEYFPSDEQFYYLANSKINKFRLYYNIVNLFNGTFEDKEVMPMLVTAFCYKSVGNRDRDNVCKELDKITKKIINLI